MKPASTKRIVFWTKDGAEHKGFFLKDANKYVRNVNRWKDEATGKWYDDTEVTCWEQGIKPCKNKWDVMKGAKDAYTPVEYVRHGYGRGCH